MIWTLPTMPPFPDGFPSGSLSEDGSLPLPGGNRLTKMMRKEEFEYDWMKITADAARNLFSWNSKCAATPFEISRMPAPRFGRSLRPASSPMGTTWYLSGKMTKEKRCLKLTTAPVNGGSVQSANGADDGSPRYGTGLIMEVIFGC